MLGSQDCHERRTKETLTGSVVASKIIVVISDCGCAVLLCAHSGRIHGDRSTSGRSILWKTFS